MSGSLKRKAAAAPRSLQQVMKRTKKVSDTIQKLNDLKESLESITEVIVFHYGKRHCVVPVEYFTERKIAEEILNDIMVDGLVDYKKMCKQYRVNDQLFKLGFFEAMTWSLCGNKKDDIDDAVESEYCSSDIEKVYLKELVEYYDMGTQEGCRFGKSSIFQAMSDEKCINSIPLFDTTSE